MADSDRGKRMVEKTILDQLLETLATITGRAVTANGTTGSRVSGLSVIFLLGWMGRRSGSSLPRFETQRTLGVILRKSVGSLGTNTKATSAAASFNTLSRSFFTPRTPRSSTSNPS